MFKLSAYLKIRLENKFKCLDLFVEEFFLFDLTQVIVGTQGTKSMSDDSNAQLQVSKQSANCTRPPQQHLPPSHPQLSCNSSLSQSSSVQSDRTETSSKSEVQSKMTSSNQCWKTNKENILLPQPSLQNPPAHPLLSSFNDNDVAPSSLSGAETRKNKSLRKLCQEYNISISLSTLSCSHIHCSFHYDSLLLL